ncbi:Palmitoyltransferase PFA4 [Nakaseomyces bracarensis]|uniref:Palmitoyltransferase PFA4 n=1 Tax=Nakaseomyces bracarensis TaxID=273131 RepID=A0ABR4NT83_9SACH
MAVKLKWPWLGIAIPSFLISFIGINAHVFILWNYLSVRKQIWYEFCQTMIWISYYLAIYTNPGAPKKDYKPKKNVWKVYCKKCQIYKPERSHHCKTCNQCILMMDHHCPWTMNCVGYNNFPHFMRFLFWVIVGTSTLFAFLLKRIAHIWKDRHSPSYLYLKSEIIFLTILTPMDLFILFTISVLFIRCLMNQILGGKTQIESWEMDRLETLSRLRRLLPKVINNTWIIYPELKNDKMRREEQRLLEKKWVPMESYINFPYDLGIISNAVTVLGSPIYWLWPFSGPTSDGMNFQKNEESIIEPDSSLCDIMLGLPWPPDSGKHLLSEHYDSTITESVSEDGEQVIRNRINSNRLSRSKWQNEWGEMLEDFGVDVDIE